MRTLLLALLLVAASMSPLQAQALKDTSCTDFFHRTLDREAVVADCTRLIDSGPLKGAALVRAYLTRIYARSGPIDHPRMIAETTAVIDIDPQARMAYMFRADSYLQLGDFDRALHDATTLIELAPKDPVALALRSSVHQAKSDFDRAIADSTRAVEIEPRDPSGYANRATTYMKAGKDAEALADLNEALSRPVPLHGHYHMRGQLLEKMGRAKDVVLDYRNALELEPGNPTYQSALKRLDATP